MKYLIYCKNLRALLSGAVDSVDLEHARRYTHEEALARCTELCDIIVSEDEALILDTLNQ
jgi:hypothetical protein